MVFSPCFSSLIIGNNFRGKLLPNLGLAAGGVCGQRGGGCVCSAGGCASSISLYLMSELFCPRRVRLVNSLGSLDGLLHNMLNLIRFACIYCASTSLFNGPSGALPGILARTVCALS